MKRNNTGQIYNILNIKINVNLIDLFFKVACTLKNNLQF